MVILINRKYLVTRAFWHGLVGELRLLVAHSNSKQRQNIETKQKINNNYAVFYQQYTSAKTCKVILA